MRNRKPLSTTAALLVAGATVAVAILAVATAVLASGVFGVLTREWEEHHKSYGEPGIAPEHTRETATFTPEPARQEGARPEKADRARIQRLEANERAASSRVR
jgi:hypothetical protein